jgi:prolyl-tRNA synthetase
MRTRLFLRTTEFLWQEGHTAHATEAEALEEAEKMLNVYADFAENFMAMPVTKGTKSPNERFAGAIETYCIEALMQDGKALQAGTSHFLGQNFAKAFDVKYLTKENKLEYVWATSWGVSTRLMGALVMTHSDNNGLVLPPKLAPIQVAIVPIFKTPEQLAIIKEKIMPIKKELEAKGISVKFDERDTVTPGWKFSEYEFKGVPVRLAIGQRDIENNTIEVARRDTLEKSTYQFTDIVSKIEHLLEHIQENLYQKAKTFTADNTFYANSWDEFKDIIEKKGGFVFAHWDGTPETEQKIKDETKATIRCIPLNNTLESGKCIYSGKPSTQKVIFAKAY